MRTQYYTLSDQWIETDPDAVADDIRRLGLAEAARYNATLARMDEEGRFPGVTDADMERAIRDRFSVGVGE